MDDLQARFEEVKANPLTTVLEDVENEFVYSCTATGCRHNPCLDDPFYPPKPHLVGAHISREYTLYTEDGRDIIKTSCMRTYEFDNPKKYVDGKEYAINWERSF